MVYRSLKCFLNFFTIIKKKKKKKNPASKRWYNVL